MPRLTNNFYYNQHYFLKKSWEHFRELFTVLEPTKQWEVHAFYQPSKELTYKELIDHRRAITKEWPSLPSRAGKSYKKMGNVSIWAYKYADGDEQKFHHAISAFASMTKVWDDKGLTVLPIVRPEPDFYRLSLALRELAEQENKS